MTGCLKKQSVLTEPVEVISEATTDIIWDMPEDPEPITHEESSAISMLEMMRTNGAVILPDGDKYEIHVRRGAPPPVVMKQKNHWWRTVFGLFGVVGGLVGAYFLSKKLKRKGVIR